MVRKTADLFRLSSRMHLTEGVPPPSAPPPPLFPLLHTRTHVSPVAFFLHIIRYYATHTRSPSAPFPPISSTTRHKRTHPLPLFKIYLHKTNTLTPFPLPFYTYYKYNTTIISLHLKSAIALLSHSKLLTVDGYIPPVRQKGVSGHDRSS